MYRSKVELFAAIRRDSRIEGLSVRALARKHGVHRRMVREALSSAFPRPRKKPLPRKSRLDPFKPAIDDMLRADLDAPRKQRHTAKRIFDRLVIEHEMEGLSYSTVSDYVSWRRGDIRREAGREPAKVFITQTHQPGREAEVDFGEVWIKVAGVRAQYHLFTFRLSFSGKAVHRPIDRTTGVSSGRLVVQRRTVPSNRSGRTGDVDGAATGEAAGAIRACGGEGGLRAAER